MTDSAAATFLKLSPVEPIADNLRVANDVTVAGARMTPLRGGTFAITVDELVLARAKKGDMAAFEKLYQTFETPVYTLARRLCRTPQDAEDVLQETFLEVMKSVKRFRGEGSFAGWVQRIASSKALMKLRHQRVRAGEQELFEDNEDVLVDSMVPLHDHTVLIRSDLQSMLGQLPDVSRVVVWLHEVEGYSHDEIGTLLGKTASFSKSQLARAFVRLRSEIDLRGKEGACTQQ